MSLPRLFLLSTLLWAANGSAFAADPDDISAASLLQLINSPQAPVIIDVRSEREFDAGHIPGAIHIPFWSAYFRSEEVPGDLLSPVVIYCQHGPRASLAGWMLRLEGFRNIRYLEGHMSNWQKLGMPIKSRHATRPL